LPVLGRVPCDGPVIPSRNGWLWGITIVAQSLSLRPGRETLENKTWQMVARAEQQRHVAALRMPAGGGPRSPGWGRCHRFLAAQCSAPSSAKAQSWLMNSR
jgi:hypothetical protein